MQTGGSQLWHLVDLRNDHVVCCHIAHNCLRFTNHQPDLLLMTLDDDIYNVYDWRTFQIVPLPQCSRWHHYPSEWCYSSCEEKNILNSFVKKNNEDMIASLCTLLQVQLCVYIGHLFITVQQWLYKVAIVIAQACNMVSKNSHWVLHGDQFSNLKRFVVVHVWLSQRKAQNEKLKGYIV